MLAPLSRFVGRDAALDHLSALVSDGARIVTVLGPPGMGKTRLLLRFVECRANELLEGGAWFIDLVLARSARDLCRATAAALGVRLPSELDGAQQIEWLGSLLADMGRAALLCDNFEQLGGDAEEALVAWCRAAPSLTMLVSSRRRLAIAGEVVFELSAMDVPAKDEDDVASFEAVRLFLDRARAAGHSVEPSEMQAVAALVRELEGLPLAIELAAARTRAASPREIVERLARGHDVLAPPARPGADGVRLRSLKSAVARSWELLADWEASALVQCAFFAGDFSLEAAENIVDLRAFQDAPPIVDVLASLRDQSLLARRVVDGETRLRMYASLRDFARERMDDQERCALAARHRRWFIESATAVADAHWRSGDVSQWRKLDRERENLLAIHRGLMASQERSREDHEDIARVVSCLEPSIATGGNLEELLQILDAGISSSLVVGDRSRAARLLVSRGTAYGLRGDNVRALRDLDHAQALADECGDVPVRAEAMVMASVRRRQQGRLADALELVTDAARLVARETDGKWPRIEGAATVVRGVLLCELGRSEESRRDNLRARAIFVDAGDTWSEALALANLAQLDQAAGDFDSAARRFDAALAIFRSFGDLPYEARYLGYRAALDHEQDRFDAAITGYRLGIARGAHVPHTVALWQGALGAALADRGERDAASEAFDKTTAVLELLDAPMVRAAVALHRGHLDLARAPADPSRALAEAKRRLEHATHADRSEDVRFAARLLQRAIERVTMAHAARAAPSPGASSAVVLVVGPSARVFRLGDGPEVDLSRRGSLQRILAWLVDQRLTKPGVASDWQVLLAQGWPNERVLVEAGATRVRVAIASLRKLGLARVLITRHDGYLLSETADVRRTPRNGV